MTPRTGCRTRSGLHKSRRCPTCSSSAIARSRRVRPRRGPGRGAAAASTWDDPAVRLAAGAARQPQRRRRRALSAVRVHRGWPPRAAWPPQAQQPATSERLADCRCSKVRAIVRRQPRSGQLRCSGEWPVGISHEGTSLSRELRINEMIRVPQVRVVDEEGNQAGVMSTQDALRLAQERGYDLVEVAPMASPPVARLPRLRPVQVRAGSAREGSPAPPALGRIQGDPAQGQDRQG